MDVNVIFNLYVNITWALSAFWDFNVRTKSPCALILLATESQSILYGQKEVSQIINDPDKA